MKKSLRDKISWIAASMFGILFIIAAIDYNSDLKTLKRDHIITSGKVISYDDAGWRTAGGTFYFEFNVGDSIIRGVYREPNILSRYNTIFIGLNFPVIYNSKNVKNNRMLITPESFKVIGIPFPDSLKWIKQYQ